MLRDLRREGPATLERFNAPHRLVWYFESVAEALEPHAATAPVGEIREGAAVLRVLAAGACVERGYCS